MSVFFLFSLDQTVQVALWHIFLWIFFLIKYSMSHSKRCGHTGTRMRMQICVWHVTNTWERPTLRHSEIYNTTSKLCRLPESLTQFFFSFFKPCYICTAATEAARPPSLIRCTFTRKRFKRSSASTSWQMHTIHVMWYELLFLDIFSFQSKCLSNTGITCIPVDKSMT